MANPRIEVEIGAVIDGLKQGFGESVKIIDTLEKQAQDLEKALKNATSIEQISTLNVDLAKTRAALSQLRNAGLEPAVKSTEKLTDATKQYNSVGTDFARIIQDAPFGIIGVGNNITQLAGSFQNLRAQSTSTGAALKTAFASIVSPANLLVLGVSAVTTALTVYSMTAKDTSGSVDDLKQSQDDFNESLKETDQLLKQGFFNQLLKDVGLIETKNLGGRLVDVPAFESANKVLEKLGGTIDRLNKNELQALQSFLGEKIADATRGAANATNELEKSLALQDFDIYKALLNEVNTQLGFYKTNTDNSTKSTKELQAAIVSFSTAPIVDAYFEAIRLGAEFENSLQKAASALTGFEGQIQLKELDIPLSGLPVIEIPDIDESSKTRFLTSLQEFNTSATQILEQGIELAIGDFAFAIGDALASGSNVLEAGGAALLNGLAGILNQLGQIAIATGVGIKSIEVALTSLNPVVAIAAGVALVALAGAVSNKARSLGNLGRGGGGGGSSVGASGVGGGSSFVGGAQGFGFAQNREIRGELVARGQDLVYVFNEANTRINKG